MNILFLSLADIQTIYTEGIYTDLMREFVKNRHNLYVVSPVERKKHQITHLINEQGVSILKVRIGNLQKTNVIEKGISTVLIGPLLKRAIQKYYSNVKFDLVIYSTPPISFVSAVRFIKKRDNAKTYLLLKDIFPQNAVDLGMLQKNGLRGIVYKYFRKQEKLLYEVSDYIGCMSQANVEYVLQHNPEIDPTRVEICPNSIEVIDKSVDEETRIMIRTKYGIPLDKIVFIYGGNLGKPQGISFLIRCLEKVKDVQEAFFLIVGNGTEYSLLERYATKANQTNFKLMQRLPKDDYDTLVAACDVGMIFLDHRFTIPNFPSRLLSYMQAKLPVFAVTDQNTDIGKVILEGGFGWWCESNSVNQFTDNVVKISSTYLDEQKNAAYDYIKKYYSVEVSYRKIISSIEKL